MATWITVKTSRYIHRKVSAIYGTEERFLSSHHLSGFWKFYLQLWNHSVFAHFSCDKFLCILVFVYPTQLPEHDQKRFDQRNIVYLNSRLKFILQLWKAVPLTAMTWIVPCFGNHAMEIMNQLSNRVWWGMILKGIFLSHTLKQLCCKDFKASFPSVHK